MADSPSRPGRDPGLGTEKAIVRGPIVPPRRQSLGEEEAFPITAQDIQAPRLPPAADQPVEPSTAAPARKRRFNVTAIVFVLVAAVGALAAVRFYVAASHDAAPIQE